MAIKKGDLVQLNLPAVSDLSAFEVQQELFTALKQLKDSDFFVVVTPPYEHEHTVMFRTSSKSPPQIVNSLVLCVDLLLGNTLYEAVPSKYLVRIT